MRMQLGWLALLAVVGAAPAAWGQTLTYGPILGRGITPDRMIVKWGTSASTGTSSLSFRVKGTGSFVPVTGTESSIAANNFDHEAILTGLSLDTAYDYQVSAGTTTASHSFTTCPPAGMPLDAVFYGDSRNGIINQGSGGVLDTSAQAEHMKLAGLILAKSPDVVFESGDLVFTGEYEDYLSQFFPAVKDLVATVPFMASPGNHDSGDPFDTGAGGLNVLGSSFARLFPTPQKDGANWAPWYAFTCGNAMFIGLDSESLVTSSTQDPAQTAFLKAQLTAARADASIDHVLVWFHHSPYSPASGLLPHGDDPTVQSQWVPLFDDAANKVTAVFTGHDHLYARLNDGSHVVYVVSGGAGASLTGANGTSKAQIKSAQSTFNFVDLHIVGKMVSGTAYDDTGAPIDTFTAQSTNTATPPASTSDGGVAAVGGDGGAAGNSVTPTSVGTGTAMASAHGCSMGGALGGNGGLPLALLVLVGWLWRRRFAL